MKSPRPTAIIRLRVGPSSDYAGMTASRHDARYQARGVSAGKEEVHAAIANQDGGLFPGAFCKIIPDLLTGSDEHCLVMHAMAQAPKAAWRIWLGWKAWAKMSGKASRKTASS